MPWSAFFCNVQVASTSELPTSLGALSGRLIPPQSQAIGAVPDFDGYAQQDPRLAYECFNYKKRRRTCTGTMPKPVLVAPGERAICASQCPDISVAMAEEYGGSAEG